MQLIYHPFHPSRSEAKFFRTIKILAAGFLFLFLLTRCWESGKSTAPSYNSKININVAHVVDSLPLLFDTLLYTTATGTQYSISRCVFYLSGFTFYDEKGNTLFASDSIFYLDARDPATLSHYIENVPPQYYHAFSFIFGLHQEDNVQGKLPNTLENINMFWPELWGGGYHFMKLEGKYFHIHRNEILGYATHIGSNNFYSTPQPQFNYFVNPHLPIQTALPESRQLNITLTMNLGNWYKNPTNYDFYQVNPQAIMEDQDAQEILKVNGSTDGFSLQSAAIGPLGALPADTPDTAVLSDCPTIPMEISAEGFPVMEHPKDNPLSQEGVKLGRKLFYDSALSNDGKSSCATCHVQANGFAGQDKPTPEELARLNKAQIKIGFSHTVDSLPLLFDTLMYISPAGIRYSISALQYYLSGFSYLGKGDDTLFTSDSVIYVDAKDTLTLKHVTHDVPNGYFRQVSFALGLSNNRNVAGSLPANPQNSAMVRPDSMGGGYHFMKWEGTYIDAVSGAPKPYAVLMGNAPNSTVRVDNRVITPLFNIGKQVSGIVQLNVEVSMNLGNWMKNPAAINFNQLEPQTAWRNQTLQDQLKSNGQTDGFAIKNVFHETLLGGAVFAGSDLRDPRALINLGWKKKFMGHGTFTSLEEQAINAVRDEMDGVWPKIMLKLKKDQAYNELFYAAFCTEDYDSTHAAKAMAQFQRTLVSTESRFDKIIKNEEQGSEEESKGFNHFFLETGDCFHCHDRPFFTDDEARNNGLDKIVEGIGRGAVTENPKDNGMIVTPTLRNIAVTAPYMRDGRFKTLEEVLDHYNSAGHSSPTVDPLIRIDTGLGLSESDKAQIIAFLKTLTDTAFLSNPDFGPPDY